MNISELLSKIKKHPLCKKNLYKEVYKKDGTCPNTIVIYCKETYI